VRSRDLVNALADILRGIGGADYYTEAGAYVQVGGTLDDRQERRDQILVNPTRKEYRARVNGGDVDFATGATGYYVAGWTFEVTACAFGLADESPADRLMDLLDDVERALMFANVVTVGASKFAGQIVSTDFTPRPDGADAEMAVMTVRLTGPQTWATT
jgi:hypothetical protein